MSSKFIKYICRWCKKPIYKKERSYFINIAEDTTFPLVQIDAFHVCDNCISDKEKRLKAL